ncbi:UNVERIFIED_ORG: hypothetical protein J2740_003656 [Rhizobium nepotum]|nr:hypothetical protein [Rhizobium nepotum]
MRANFIKCRFREIEENVTNRFTTELNRQNYFIPTLYYRYHILTRFLRHLHHV